MQHKYFRNKIVYRRKKRAWKMFLVMSQNCNTLMQPLETHCSKHRWLSMRWVDLWLVSKFLCFYFFFSAERLCVIKVPLVK